MDWKDLDLYERTPESYYGVDKDGNVYGIGHTGNIKLLPGETINGYWYHASIGEVEQYMERQTKYLEEQEKLIKKNSKKKKKKPEILSPEINGFTTYYSYGNRVLNLTKIMFTEERIIITESEDDFDCSSMERNEYYIIEPDNFLNLINKLEKNINQCLSIN